MLSIGQFSKICGVSAKTLRYYDELGLLRPTEINSENGYRYYSIHQLKRMLMIERLKSYHFSLDEITVLMQWEEEKSEDEFYNALEHKRRQIQEKIRGFEYTVQQMSRDMMNLSNNIPLMAYLNEIDVQLVETQSMNILYLRQIMSRENYAEGYGRYFNSIFDKIAREHLTLDGLPMTLYHSPDYNPAGNDTEFAIPIKEAIKGTRDFPGSICAKSVHKGPYLELTSAYARLMEWSDKEGYTLVKSPYEIYLTDPHLARVPEDIVTEVYFPVKKR